MQSLVTQSTVPFARLDEHEHEHERQGIAWHGMACRDRHWIGYTTPPYRAMFVISAGQDVT